MQGKALMVAGVILLGLIVYFTLAKKPLQDLLKGKVG